MSWQWPVTLEGSWAGHAVRLRPLRPFADRREFTLLRQRNASWTRPWDSTAPVPHGRPVPFAQMVRQYARDARSGESLPFAIEVDGALAGQMHLFGVQHGALLSGAAGYWISRTLAGQGITPYALAMLVDHALGQAGLHRVEVNIRPDNPRSLRVVAKLGFRDEGTRVAYLHINGSWHDHRTFAVTVEDLNGGTMVGRLLQSAR